MTEPNAATAAGIALGAGIGLTGTVLGAQVDALVIGLIASILVTFAWPALDTKPKAAAAVAFSSMVAGYFSPVLAGWLATSVVGIDNGQPLQMAMALLLGASTPTLTPVLFRRLGLVIEGGRKP